MHAQVTIVERSAWNGLNLTKLNSTRGFRMSNSFMQCTIDTPDGSLVPTYTFSHIPSDPTQCFLNHSSATGVSCKCARNKFSNTISPEPLPGGREGACLCAAGQFGANGVCLQCDRGTYSPNAGTDLCIACPSNYTYALGSTNLSDCKKNPTLVEEELYESERAKNTAQTKLVVIGGSLAGFTIIACLIGICCLHKMQRRNLDLQCELNSALNEQMGLQDKEIEYYKDWRVKEEDINLVEKLASGSEGEVWRGTLRGQFGEQQCVAIKKSYGLGRLEGTPVWNEAEVAFMMHIKHPRLVTFHGAGEMLDVSRPDCGELLLFTVQEYMTGPNPNGVCNPVSQSTVTVRWQVVASIRGCGRFGADQQGVL